MTYTGHDRVDDYVPKQAHNTSSGLSKIQLFPQEGHTDIDVVCVHGLGKSWQQTWGGRDFSTSWLRYIQKDLPAARIVTCGFSVIDSMSVDPSAFEKASQSLLEDLESLWQGDSTQRSLVFIAHSLGGLILRMTLMRCSPRILDAVKGVIFLGTPHYTTTNEWEAFGQRIAKSFKEQQLLTVEKAQSLLKANADFIEWLEPKNAWAEHVVYCFGEGLPVYRVGLIVPEDSSRLPRVKCTSASLHADHFNISRCRTAFDPQYQRLSLIIQTVSTLKLNMGIRLSPKISYEQPKESEKCSLLLDGREFLKHYGTKSHAPMRFVAQGLAFEDQGQYNEAEREYDHAISMCKGVGDEYYSIELFCKDKKALMLMDRCEYTEADDLSLQTLEARKRTRGKADPATLLSAGNRARILRYLGRYVEAYELLRDALANVPDCPFNTVIGTTVVSILAKILKDQGILEVSELLTRDVVRACEHHLGREHPFTYNRQSDLGVVLSKRQQFSAAEEITRKALNGLGATLGAMHPHTLRASKRLGSYLRFQGHLTEAQAILQVTLERQVTIFTHLHPDTLSTQCSLAAVYALLDRFEEADTLLERALKDRTFLFDINHADVIWTDRMLKSAKKLRKMLSNGLPNKPEEVQELRSIFLSPTTPSKDSIAARTREFQCPQYEPDRAYPDDAAAIEALHAGADSKNTRLIGKDLRYAAATGNVDLVRTHLENEANINAEGGYYGDALQAAAFSGKEETVELLLGWSKGQHVNVNSQRGIFGSALRAAALGGHDSVVRLLLAKEADPCLEHPILGSPLEAALVGRHASVVKLLIDSQPDVVQGEGHPLNRLIRKMIFEGDVGIVQFLAKAIDDSNKKNALGSLQLEHTMTQQNLLQLLLNRYSVVQQNEMGSALQAAFASGNVDAIKMLLHPLSLDECADTSDADFVATSIYGLQVVVKLLLDQNSKKLESVKAALEEKALEETALDQDPKVETLDKRHHASDHMAPTVASAKVNSDQPTPRLERRVTKFTDDVQTKTKETPTGRTERRLSSKSWSGRSNEEKSGLKARVRRQWRRMTTR